MKTANHCQRYLLMILIALLTIISVSEAISCFECSSVNDHYCPDTMSTDDEDIVPYEDCAKLHESQYCVKTTGVTGGNGSCGASELSCFVCDETTSRGDDFSCSNPDFLDRVQSCKDVFDAQYCIKTIGLFGGSLGTRRFCSSRDMGNYCDYIKRPGDQLEYRSCVYTCTGNGCNGSLSTTFTNLPSIHIILATSVLTILFSHYNPLFTKDSR